MLRYNTVLHEVQEKLDLSLNEYVVVNSIHKMASSRRSKVGGWCAANQESLANILRVSRRGVQKIIHRMKERGLIESHPTRSTYSRATDLWINTVELVENNTNKVHISEDVSGTEFAEDANKVRTKDEQSAHPSYSSSSSDNIDRSLLKKSIESRVKDLAQEMTLEQMHLETICMNQKLEMDYVKNLISSWAQENASTTFQSTNHKRNSFRKFVSNSKMKVAYKGGGQAPRAHTIIQPGERRKKLG